MARRVLESLRGVGQVFAGDVLLRQTTYEISLWVDDGPGVTAHDDRPVNVDGRLDIAGVGEAVVLVAAPDLTLRLEDGRRLPIALSGTAGGVVGRGRLPSA